MKLRLRAKFLIPTISLVVLGMALATAISYHIASSALRDAVNGRLEQLTDAMLKSVSAWVTERKREVTKWSEISVFEAALQDDFTAKFSRDSVNDMLVDFKKEYPFYETLNLANKEGIILCSSNQKSLEIKVHDREYFQEAIKGQIYVSQVIKSRLSDAAIFVISCPVKVKNQVAGVFFGVLDLGSVTNELVNPIKVGRTGYAFMFDSTGLVVSHPKKENIMKLNMKDFDFGRTMLTKGEGTITYVFEGLEKIVAFRKDKLTNWTVAVSAGVKESLASARRIGYIILVTTLALVIFLGAAMVFLMGRTITRPLGRAIEVMDKMAKGNLRDRVGLASHDEVGLLGRSIDGLAETLADVTGRLKEIGAGDLSRDIPKQSSEDEIADAAQQMLINLREIVGLVNEASVQIAGGSSQVAASSQSLSQGATQQAASLEEISSSMTEVGSQTKTNAENANQANKLALSARNAAVNGNSQMQEMISAMSGINHSAREIAKIIKAIDDIAFQTNLLALNAAVEAARAGKHGKGFAVVAQEVRNLAARSAKAAKETAELIEGSVKKVEEGVSIVARTADALREIGGGITKVTDLIGEIAAASNEQAQGIAQINLGLGQVDNVTQQNTSSAEETASAAVELSDQAARLRNVLARFILKEQAARQAVVTAPVRSERETKSRAATTLANADKSARPEDVISLDDREFGKY